MVIPGRMVSELENAGQRGFWGPLEMKDQRTRTTRTACRVLSILFFGALMPTFGWADALTQTQLLALMIENQGDNASLIGSIFGPDGTAPLTFTSDVNVSGDMFSFSLAPTPYLQQNLTITGIGFFDATTDLLHLFSLGVLGSVVLMTEGTDAITLSPDGGLNGSSDVNFLEGGVKVHDIHAEGFLRSDGTTGGFGFDTDENGDEIKGSVRVFTDTQTPTGNWGFQSSNPGLGFVINSEGFSPLAGGSGTFTTTIAALPEPSAVLPIGSCVVVLAIVSMLGRRKKHGPWAQ